MTASELDRKARDVVRQQSGGSCYVCGKEGHDVAHLFVRNKLRTRWDLRNLRLLCRSCHDDDHRGSGIYASTYINREGQEAYDEVRFVSNQMVRNVKMFMAEQEEKLDHEFDR